MSATDSDPGPQALPDRLQDVVEEFHEVSVRERLQLLLEYADAVPELPAHLADDRAGLEQVHECQSPLFLAVDVGPAPDHAVRLFFDAPPEAPTTRGFAGILHAGLDGLPAATVLAVPGDAPMRLGLAEAVSPLRLRGMSAMLTRIQRQVRRALAAG
jgi:cysteine desulfuration protein SufE